MRSPRSDSSREDPLDKDQFDDLLHRSLKHGLTGKRLDLEDEDAADLALLHEALSNYKAESLEFAEQKSAAMPLPRVSKTAALWQSTPRWAVATVAAVALVCTTFAVNHRSGGPAPVATIAAPTEQALSDDNRLLLSVDQALNSNAAPTEEELGLRAIPAPVARRGRVLKN